MYQIKIKRRLLKKLESLPRKVQDALFELVEDLKERGPVQPKWPNYSKLNRHDYHCHLNYHYVACWRNEKKIIIIEVYYVGSRENAPY